MKQSRPQHPENATRPPASAVTGGEAGGSKARLLISTVVHVGLALAALSLARWALSGPKEATAHAGSWPTPPPQNAPLLDTPPVGEHPAPTTDQEHAAIEAPSPAGALVHAAGVVAVPPVTEAVANDDSVADAADPRPVEDRNGSDRGPEMLSRIVDWPDRSVSDTPAQSDSLERPASSDAATARPSLTTQRQTSEAVVTATPLPPGGVRPDTAIPVGDVAWTDAAPSAPSVDWVAPDPVAASSDAILTTGQVRATGISYQPNASADHGGTGATLVAKPGIHTVAVAGNAAAARTIAPAAVDAPTYETGAFFGLPAGRDTVYLIDASGSLIDTLPYAITEVRRAISTLSPEQSYAVVFFRGSEIVEAPPLGMQPADRRNITETLNWLEPRLNHLVAAGRTDAIAAMAHALSYDPDTLVLLSDGITGPRTPEADRRKLVSMTERVRRRPRIQTVQFIDPDPLASRGRMGTLELLSSLSNGQHRFVGIDDVRPVPTP